MSKKGMVVLCDGVVELNEYDGQDGTRKASLRLTAREVKFLSSRDEAQAAPAGGDGDDGSRPF